MLKKSHEVKKLCELELAWPFVATAVLTSS